MKNQFYIFFFLGISFCGSAQIKDEQSFKVVLRVENLKSPAKLIMTVRELTQWIEYVAESQDGRFMVSGSVKQPSFAYLTMKYGNEFDKAPRLGNVAQLFVTNQVIKIETKDLLASAKFEGGIAQKELEELRSKLNEHSNNIQTKISIVKEFIVGHPNSFVSIYAIQNLLIEGSFSTNSEGLASLFDLLSSEIRQTASGKQLSQDILIAKNTMLNAQAPDFVQGDTLAKPFKLSSLRGKYVLIDFWASWCKPCRVENPELVKVFHEFRDKGFTIVGVSLDNNRGNWLKAIRKDGLGWQHVSDLKFWRNEVAQLYGVKNVPQNYLISPEGKIVARNIKVGMLSEELGKWMP
ncbi:MAG: peroxiredoxin family protein [Cyclobacteriaceae bacterium]